MLQSCFAKREMVLIKLIALQSAAGLVEVLKSITVPARFRKKQRKEKL